MYVSHSRRSCVLMDDPAAAAVAAAAVATATHAAIHARSARRDDGISSPLSDFGIAAFTIASACRMAGVQVRFLLTETGCHVCAPATLALSCFTSLFRRELIGRSSVRR